MKARVSSQLGFTLIELVVAIVALAALGAGIAAVFIDGPAASANPQIRSQARAIADGYMEEILLKRYCEDPTTCDDEVNGGGAESDEAGDRSLYDDVWDYCDIGGNSDCSGGEEPPTDQNGDTLTANDLNEDYTVDVAIQGDDPTSSNPGPATIRVTVTHTSGIVDYELVSQRANY